MLTFLFALIIAQEPQDRPVFSSRSELVVLHVSVADGRTGFVQGLTRDAFTVYEDGRPQPIRFFENEDTPVTAGLVIDNSGSMLPRREAVVAAGLAFAGMALGCFAQKPIIVPHGLRGPYSGGQKIGLLSISTTCPPAVV